MELTARGGQRTDWKAERDRIDLAAVATNLLGPAPGRRGERGRRIWWSCPFHEDANPSFAVDPGKGWWRCYGCGQSGDAANLVMKLRGVAFPEAVACLTGGLDRAGQNPNPPRDIGFCPNPSGRPARSSPKPPPEPSGLPEADARALVETAESRLWSPVAAEALAYLTGSRGLTLETIRAARLGWTPGVSIPTRDGDRAYRASGWVIPWFAGPRLALAKIRQPDGSRPKYAEAFRKLPGLFLGNGPIRAGIPLVIVEGEFDALLLGQELADLAAVVTLGSASGRPASATLSPMLAAFPWYVATDNDPAGDKAAEGWPAKVRRVRPPAPFKDWTDARAGGVNLRRWWAEALAGVERPALRTWEEVEDLRWGPGLTCSDPGIEISKPSGARS